MSEHHLDVPRTARYHTLGPLESPREVWFVLHGYGQLAEHFIRGFRPLDDGTRLVVAPEALSRFYLAGTRGRVGASWMTKADREAEIDDYVRYLDTLAAHLLPADRSSTRVLVLGFSQGAATAARWACRGTVEADAVVLWGGSLPPEIDLDTNRGRLAGLTLVLGTEDEYRNDEAVAAERERLRGAEIAYTPVEYVGTHRIEREPLERVAEMVADPRKRSGAPRISERPTT